MPNRIYNNVPVEIPNRSGFFESHYNHFSGKVGTLIPVLTDLLIPGDSINVGVSCSVSLPPMVSDFFGHIDMKFEAFFVPLRLCYGGFQDMITHNMNQGYPSGTTDSAKPQYLPYFNIPSGNYGPGSLFDYLGGKVKTNSNTLKVDNPLPFVAYHLIYQEWYSNPFIQTQLFKRVLGGASVSNNYAYSLPYTLFSGSSPSNVNALLYDDSYLYSLRQRNWERDYFTNGKPTPQAGDASSLAFTVDTSTGNGSFTIASLRAANALQQWLERNNLAGFRYSDQIKAHFGVRPSDAVVDRPIYLGQQIIPVYTKGVTQTAQGEANTENNSQPFSGVGTKYGQSMAVGEGHLGNISVTEYGYLMVIASLVPRPIYSSGIRRHLFYNKRADFPTPILQSVGDQVIDKRELLTNGPSEVPTSGSVFAYAQRYAEFKDMIDEVHGLLQDGSSLDMFTLQRSFETDVQLGTSFIQIPTDYLDQVASVKSSVSEFGYWCDAYFDYTKTSVLSAYSIPTLGELKNTHTEVIPNGGTML